MGLLDRFKKTKNTPSPKKTPPKTLSDVITQEVEKVKAMSPEEQAAYKKQRLIEEENYKKQRALEHKMVDNNLKGKDLEEQGRIDDAIKCYEENVFKLKTEAPFPYDRLASLYHYKKEFENEKTTLELFFKHVKEGTKVNESYKIDYAKRLENVEQFLDTGDWKFDCLPFDPKPVYYDIKEAKRVLNSDDKEKGIWMLEDIMEKGTYNNTVYYTLYQTYKKDKCFDDCIRVCNKAIEVLGFYSNDRKGRWNGYLEKSMKQKEKLG